MDEAELDGRLRFLREAARLKDVLRSAHTASGRQESTAEHSWRLCLWVLVFADALEGIDLAKLLKMSLVHDLGEALRGDVPAIYQTAGDDRAALERADLLTLTASLPETLRAEIVELWDDYEAAASPEAVLAKGLDKLETIMQHNQGRNPADFDYVFNLNYGAQRTAARPLLAQIRAVLDEETRARAGLPTAT